MWYVQSLGSHNWSVTHSFLHPNVPYLCLGVSELDFGLSAVVNWRVHEVSILRHFLNDTIILYITHAIYSNTWTSQVIELALIILLYILTYLRWGVSKSHFGRSGVVNGLVCGVSVPSHFLNDTNILYIIHEMCAISWKSQLNCGSFF